MQRGVYTTERAASLAGVPKSTVYYWTRSGLLTPSVSPEKQQLWSYADLIRLRIVEWLRQPKEHDGKRIPAIGMKEIRAVLEKLHGASQSLWDDGVCPVRVSPTGKIYINKDGSLEDARGQLASEVWLDPIEPFADPCGAVGPNLARPRPLLVIHPDRLGGSPHVEGTRLETSALYALHRRGLPTEKIHALYPYTTPEQVGQAIDLEEQLAANLTHKRAA